MLARLKIFLFEAGAQPAKVSVSLLIFANNLQVCILFTQHVHVHVHLSLTIQRSR